MCPVPTNWMQQSPLHRKARAFAYHFMQVIALLEKATSVRRQPAIFETVKTTEPDYATERSFGSGDVRQEMARYTIILLYECFITKLAMLRKLLCLPVPWPALCRCTKRSIRTKRIVL